MGLPRLHGEVDALEDLHVVAALGGDDGGVQVLDFECGHISCLLLP
jgi:hypothetical protein